MDRIRRTFIILTIFSVAMAFMESAVVIYLRELYYPAGFKFPLVAIPDRIAVVEIIREAATIIMLAMIGMLAGQNSVQRFGFFLFCFALWDIFYYVFLKLFLDWPETILTPDILFLIPVPWVGPVLAPCIASATMIVLTLVLVYYKERKVEVKIDRREWLLLVLGSGIILAAFMQDYFMYSTAGGGAIHPGEFTHYVPQTFNWPLFFAGELMIVGALWRMRMRFRSLNPPLVMD